MTVIDPYKALSSEIETASVSGETISKKELIPLWIKIFGWLFIVLGVLVPVVGLYSAFSGVEGEFSLYGLEVTGHVSEPTAILVMLLYLFHGVCAFGLLFYKSWGVNACIGLAYVSMAICCITMLTGDDMVLRLELIVLLPYLIKLYKIKESWKVAYPV